MYARLATYRAPEGAPEATDAELQQSVRLVTDQEGCRGGWRLVEEGGDPEEGLFFSLWDTKEQAEAAGDNARQGLLDMFAAHGIPDVAPPKVRIFAVEASSADA